MIECQPLERIDKTDPVLANAQLGEVKDWRGYFRPVFKQKGA